MPAEYQVRVERREDSFEVDSAWVLGHLRSAMPSDQLGDDRVDDLRQRIDRVVPDGSLETILTTVITATCP